MLHYKSYSTPNYHISDAVNYNGIKSQYNSATERAAKKTILTLDCGSDVTELISKAFTNTHKEYEILDARDLKVSHGSLEVLHPQILVLGVEKCDEHTVEIVKSLKINPMISDIPLILFAKERPALEDIDKMMAAGVLDYLSLSIDRMELVTRMKATLMHAQTLNMYKEREAQLRGERDELVSHFENLKGEVDTKQRESLAHLELLLRSKKVNETLMDKIHDLKPFLNPQGKTKLNFITKQMKWELDEEEELSLQRRLDESNFDLYKQLEEKNVGLTKYEMRLCAYLKTNHSAANIARITKKSSNCINVAFARIRAKLGVANNVELKAMLEEMDLVKA